jgi:2-dehydro-3-deoxyphosphogluconate aldolase/(4S)-4-hydroxy-2-oxoglutarate aldolase
MNIDNFKHLPILGILRGMESDAVEPLIDAIISAGLRTIEITMNTAGAAGLIRDAAKAAKGRLTIGAGTVLDMEGLEAALGAGATFIVMPVLVKDVAAHCVKNRIPVFPGALTPSEIHAAWSSGATMVKVFPAGLFGPGYFREIKAPFAEIELLACGGVTPENMGEYFASGASAVSFGASVFTKESLAKRDFAAIASRIRAFVGNFSAIKR